MIKCTVIGLLAISFLGCDDPSKTDCTGEIPTTITLVDPEGNFEKPCTVSEAEEFERATNQSVFRKNNDLVICLINEAKTTCTELVEDKETYFVCETYHSSWDDIEDLNALKSVVRKSEDCI